MNRKTLGWVAAVAVTTAISGTAVTASAEPAASNPLISKSAAKQTAQTESAKIASVIGVGPQERLVVKDAIVTKDGTRHLRYDRTYQGLRVLGGDLVVTESNTGEIRSITKASNAALNVSVTPGMSAAQAATAATASQPGIKWTAAKPELVVYAVRTAPVLAYETLLTGVKADQTPTKLHVFTDATSGAVLYTYDSVEQVAGTGNSEYSGTVALETTESGGQFQLIDGTRGGQQVSNADTNELYVDDDNTWGTGEGTDDQTAAVDAAYGAASTWDFYKNTFGRNGIKDDGVGAESFVHYGDAYVNAFWDDSCFCMTYGDGIGDSHPLTALDVAGHEMSHGVTAATAEPGLQR